MIYEKFFASLIICLLIVPFVSADMVDSVKGGWDFVSGHISDINNFGDFWDKILDIYYYFVPYFKYFLGFSLNNDEMSQIDVEGSAVSGGYFWIGFLAAFWIFLFYTGTKAFKILKFYFTTSKKKWVNKDEEELAIGKLRWLNMVAGKFWKVIVVGVVFWVLSTIPIVNRVLQILTLDFLGISGFFMSIVVAIEIGFGPWFIQNYLYKKLEIKYSKGVYDVSKMKSNV